MFDIYNFFEDTFKHPNYKTKFRHAQFAGKKHTHKLTNYFMKLSCLLFAECSWWDGAGTTRTIWSQRSGRRHTTHQKQSWLQRKRRNRSSKHSDPSRLQPVESPALFSVTPSSGRTNISDHRSKALFSQSCSCLLTVFFFFFFLLFSKFINMMMKHGNKILAREIMTQVRTYRPLQTHSKSQDLLLA